MWTHERLTARAGRAACSSSARPPSPPGRRSRPSPRTRPGCWRSRRSRASATDYSWWAASPSSPAAPRPAWRRRPRACWPRRSGWRPSSDGPRRARGRRDLDPRSLRRRGRRRSRCRRHRGLSPPGRRPGPPRPRRRPRPGSAAARTSQSPDPAAVHAAAAHPRGDAPMTPTNRTSRPPGPSHATDVLARYEGALAGEVALVTGAGTGSAGLPRTPWPRLAPTWPSSDGRPEPLDAVAAEIAAAGRRAIACPADVADVAAMEAAVARAADALAGRDRGRRGRGQRLGRHRRPGPGEPSGRPSHERRGGRQRGPGDACRRCAPAGPAGSS